MDKGSPWTRGVQDKTTNIIMINCYVKLKIIDKRKHKVYLSTCVCVKAFRVIQSCVPLCLENIQVEVL